MPQSLCDIDQDKLTSKQFRYS